MKRAKYLQVARPRVYMDLGYDVERVSLKTGSASGKAEKSISSNICSNARINPNFEDPVAVFDVVSALHRNLYIYNFIVSVCEQKVCVPL